MATITLLDGGMGQELVARSGDDPTPLWATRVMIDHPGLVRNIHADYFAAGATVATTNTYAIHHDRLERFGMDPLFHALHLRALAEAHEARSAHGSGLIAGSMGPLVATYRPEVTLPVAVAAPKYAEIAQILAPHVDLEQFWRRHAVKACPVAQRMAVVDFAGQRRHQGNAVRLACRQGKDAGGKTRVIGGSLGAGGGVSIQAPPHPCADPIRPLAHRLRPSGSPVPRQVVFGGWKPHAP